MKGTSSSLLSAIFLPSTVSALQRAVETKIRKPIPMGGEDNPTTAVGNLIQDKILAHRQRFSCCAATKRRSDLSRISARE
jgi:hypothetical protein